MNRSNLTKVLLATVTCTLAATQLRALDVLDSGWKFGFDAGPNWIEDQNFQTTGLFTLGTTETTSLDFKTGYRLDLSAGYQFCRWFTLEEEIGYISNPVDIYSSFSTTYTTFNQVPLMTDATFTLPFFGIIKPYVGGGLGVVWTGAGDLADINGAGQLMAGLKCNLPLGFDAGIGYKLLVTSEHTWNDIFDTVQGSRTVSQSILATVSIKF